MVSKAKKHSTRRAATRTGRSTGGKDVERMDEKYKREYSATCMAREWGEGGGQRHGQMRRAGAKKGEGGWAKWGGCGARVQRSGGCGARVGQRALACVIYLDQSYREPSNAEAWIFLIGRANGIIQSYGLEGDYQTVRAIYSMQCSCQSVENTNRSLLEASLNTFRVSVWY